jgi:hypothetical protein
MCLFEVFSFAAIYDKMIFKWFLVVARLPVKLGSRLLITCLTYVGLRCEIAFVGILNHLSYPAVNFSFK